RRRRPSAPRRTPRMSRRKSTRGLLGGRLRDPPGAAPTESSPRPPSFLRLLRAFRLHLIGASGGGDAPLKSAEGADVGRELPDLVIGNVSAPRRHPVRPP